VAGAEVLEQRARAVEDEPREQADAADMDGHPGFDKARLGQEQRLCERADNDGRVSVREYGSRHPGVEGVCGTEAGWHVDM